MLFEHPAIAEAAVIGLPDDKWGEVVTALVRLRQARTLDCGELEVFCRERIAGYKLPRRIGIVEELPKNPSGKVLKHQLRTRVIDGEFALSGAREETPGLAGRAGPARDA